MKNQIDYSGFIDRYLNRKMEHDELDWFREEMEINPSLREEVQFQKEIGRAILNEETLAFRAHISSMFEREAAAKPQKARKKLSISPSVRMAVASLASLILLGTGIYLYTHRTIPADKLFNAYYEPYEGLTNVRSGNSQTADILMLAMQRYENREFQSALLLFETVIASDRDNMTSRFYSGISYMETERYRNAEKSLEGVIKHDDNLFIEHAEWYLGLCYLKTGEQNLAKETFVSIADAYGYYSRPAKRLLRNL